MSTRATHISASVWTPPTPCVQPSAHSEISSSSHSNHALAVPGFGLDHQNRKLYYRFVAPFMPRGGLQDKEVRLYFQLTLKQAAEFFASLKQVAEGADPVATVDAIRRAAKQKDDD